MFLAGGLVFVAALLLSAISLGIHEICGARIIQGIGATAIYSTNPSLVRLIYPGDRLRRGIELAGMSNALALALGPVAGTFMMYLVPRRLIFLINLPLGLFLGLNYLPSSKTQELVLSVPVSTSQANVWELYFCHSSSWVAVYCPKNLYSAPPFSFWGSLQGSF